ncbi:MAG: hypothetical protein KF764_33710 [Labilithrix sp.]|nr:hypothetical protein [Labilithrix sp.]
MAKMHADRWPERGKGARVVLSYLGLGVSIVALFLGWRWWESPERVFQAEEPWRAAMTTKLCAIRAASKAPSGSAPAVPPTSALHFLGSFNMTFDSMNEWNRAGNMDVIETTELAWFCDPRGRRDEGRVFHSRFVQIAASTPESRKDWDVRALQNALAALKRVEYLALVQVDQIDGRFRGHASIHHVDDGRFVDGVLFDAPESTITFHTIPPGGPDIATPFNTWTSKAGPFQDVVVRAFAARGITLTTSP